PVRRRDAVPLGGRLARLRGPLGGRQLRGAGPVLPVGLAYARGFGGTGAGRAHAREGLAPPAAKAAAWLARSGRRSCARGSLRGSARSARRRSEARSRVTIVPSSPASR